MEHISKILFFKDRTGEKHKTTEGYWITIIEYFGWDNCTIQFEDGYIVKNKTYTNIKKGNIRNHFHPSVHGVGYLGIGRHIAHNKSKFTKVYKTWSGILYRCYSSECHQKQPSYKGCTVSEKWHNFQNFADWFEENYKEGFALDKDILSKGDKIYSPETCCFVPVEINSFFVKKEKSKNGLPKGVSKTKSGKFSTICNIKGSRTHLGTFDTVEEAFEVYKIAKENESKRLANKWRNKITKPCYEALMNCQVEITD